MFADMGLLCVKIGTHEKIRQQKKTDMFVGFGAGTQITLWQDYFGQDYFFSVRWSDFYAEAVTVALRCKPDYCVTADQSDL